MNKKKQKLELTWIGKDERPKLEPRILIEDPELSYHAEERRSETDVFDNILIHGDNLLALKALEAEYTGKVKCIYIDPPYNTDQALNSMYEDGLEHSIWLSLMKDRFQILRNLLTDDGVFFCQLNDDEAAYAKVVLDEIFGRQNFLNQVSVKMKQTSGASGGGEDKKLKKNIEYILIYTKDRNGFTKFNEVFEEGDLFDLIYSMRDEGKSWKYTRVITNYGKKKYVKTIQDGSGQDIKIFEHADFQFKTIKELMKEDGLDEEACYAKYYADIFRDTNAQSSIRQRVMDATEDSGELISIEYVPKSGRSKGKLTTLYYKGRNRDLIAWLRDICVKKGNRLVRLEKLGTYWEGFPLNNLTKEGGVKFPHGKKPEALIQRIIELATQTGDLVLDSFLGSATTAAAAHKMKRKWIGIELGEHAHSHCVPRLRKVIDGNDHGGITSELNWKGGGGFRYYRLAPSLLEKDKYGNWVISKEYNAAMLAEALCKNMGFTYAPSQDENEYWRHGHSTETDFIFVTTASMTHAALKKLSEDVGPDRSLLVCCKAFNAKTDAFDNLTIKKIPHAVLSKCEWGKDDYSLNVANLPMAKSDEEIEQERMKEELPLFGNEEG